MTLKQLWDKFMSAVGRSATADRGWATTMPPIRTGTVLDDPVERARLTQLPPEEQTAMLAQALQAAPEYREQLAQAAAAWGTIRQPWVVSRMRQALGPATTKKEMRALIDAYRRLT
jgi:hypothetical protein